MITDRRYIGQTSTTFRHRWLYHIKDLLRKTHHNYKLQRDFKIYGIKAFSFRIIEIMHNRNDLLLREDYWIRQRIADGKELYNIRKKYEPKI